MQFRMGSTVRLSATIPGFCVRSICLQYLVMLAVTCRNPHGDVNGSSGNLLSKVSGADEGQFGAETVHMMTGRFPISTTFVILDFKNEVLFPAHVRIHRNV